jgi:hypothetical protein
VKLTWVHLVRQPLTGVLYQPRMIDEECGAVGGMRIGRGNRSTRTKPAPLPLCPPQILHDLAWARTQAVAVGSYYLHLRFDVWSCSSVGIVNIVRAGWQTDRAQRMLAVFWDVTLYGPPVFRCNSLRTSSGAKISTCWLLLVPCMDYSSARKMEAVSSSDISVNILPDYMASYPRR